MPLTLLDEKIRRERLKMAGMCRFHVNRPVASETRCQECLDRDAQRAAFARAKNKAAGKCPQHAQNEPMMGRTYCFECQLKSRLTTSGLPPDERAKALIAFRYFDGHCYCCDTTNPGTRGWCLDHCHLSNRFRGIVCWSCNTMLGMAHDSVVKLKAGIQYLTSFSNEYVRTRPVTSQADGGSTPPASTNTLPACSVSAGATGFDA